MKRGEEQKEAKSVEEGNRGEGDWDGKSSFSEKFYVETHSHERAAQLCLCSSMIFYYPKITYLGTSLVGQWLGSSLRGRRHGFGPWSETKTPQAVKQPNAEVTASESHAPQHKTPQAAAQVWHSRTNIPKITGLCWHHPSVSMPDVGKTMHLSNSTCYDTLETGRIFSMPS